MRFFLGFTQPPKNKSQPRIRTAVPPPPLLQIPPLPPLAFKLQVEGCVPAWEFANNVFMQCTINGCSNKSQLTDAVGYQLMDAAMSSNIAL